MEVKDLRGVVDVGHLNGDASDIKRNSVCACADPKSRLLVCFVGLRGEEKLSLFQPLFFFGRWGFEELPTVHELGNVMLHIGVYGQDEILVRRVVMDEEINRATMCHGGKYINSPTTRFPSVLKFRRAETISAIARSLVARFASTKAREFMHPSQSTWVGHWMNLSNTQVPRNNFKLPYVGMSIKQAPDQNLSQAPGGNQLKKLETDLNIPCGSDENDSLRDGHGLVEVMPTLLREKVIAEFDTSRSVDVLFELVTRSPNNVVCSLPMAVRSPNPLSPESLVNSRTLESAPPVISSYKMLGVPFSQKANNAEFAAGECSLSHANAMSCEVNTFPSVLNEHSEQELGSAAKEEDAQVKDLENQPHQMLKPAIGNGCLFGAKLDKHDFIGTTPDGLMHGMLVPGPLTSSTYSEGKNMQGSFIDTCEEHITCIRSTYCTNENLRSGSCFTFEKKMKMLKETAKGYIHSLPGDFISSLTVEDEGRITQRCLGMEFTDGTSKVKHEPSKFAEICSKIPKAIATCSIHNVPTLRIHTTLDEVERVLGGPSNSEVLKTTQPYLIMKRADVSLSKERSVLNQVLDADQNSFFGTVDLFPSSCFCDKRAVKSRLSRKPKIDVLTKDFCGSYHKSSSNAEDSLPGKHKRIFSPNSVADDKIHIGKGCYDACVQQSHALPISKENHQCIDEISGTKISVDSVEFANRTSCCDTRHESFRRDQLDLNADPGNSGQTVDTIHKDFVDIITSSQHYHLDNKSESLNCFPFIRYATKRISASSADDLNSNVHWPGSPFSAASDMGLDPRIRWVKRLKHSHLEAFGTKKSTVEEICDEGKGIKLSNKLPDYSKSTSKSPFLSGMCELKQKSQAHGAAVLPRRTKSAAELLIENREIFSNPWIQRLHPSELRGMQMEPVDVTSGPETTKGLLAMQARDFPSIGAMALMGKVLCNFRTCRFRNTGSSVVWKTAGE